MWEKVLYAEIDWALDGVGLDDPLELGSFIGDELLRGIYLTRCLYCLESLIRLVQSDQGEAVKRSSRCETTSTISSIRVRNILMPGRICMMR